MQKDENDLFPVFIKYYGKAFEHNQIHVFDNGSSRTMNAALDHARSLGVYVNLDFDTPQDFERKPSKRREQSLRRLLQKTQIFKVK